MNDLTPRKETQKLAKVIAMMNWKGGVGKSTLSSICASAFNSLDKKNNILSKSVVLNIALGQVASSINEIDTIDLVDLQESDSTITAIDAVAMLMEEYDYIFLDTPGELSEELLEVIEHVDTFVIPFDKGRRVFEDTIGCVKSVFASGVIDKDNTTFDVCMVYNKFNKTETVLEQKNKYFTEINNLSLDSNNKIRLEFASLSNSDAVETMEDSKKSIESLNATNKAAYRIFNKKVENMTTVVKNFVDSSN